MEISTEKQNIITAYENGNVDIKKCLRDLYPDVFPLHGPENINSFEDVLRANKITQAELDEYCKDMEPDEQGFKEGKLLSIAFNRPEWIPDPTDVKQDRYFPVGRYIPGSGFSLFGVGGDYGCAHVGARLTYENEQLARAAFNKFPEIFARIWS